MKTFLASRRVRAEGRLHLISTQAATHEVRGPEVVVVHYLEREDGVRILAGQLEALQPHRRQVLLLHGPLFTLPLDGHLRERVGRRGALGEHFFVDREELLGPDHRDAQDVGRLVDLCSNS